MTDEATGQLPIFVAMDFETANRSPRSAVAMALTRVVGGVIERRVATLLRPPTRSFSLKRIHGINAADVADAPDFAAAWPRAKGLLDGARFIAAHHAAFDQGVLGSCCQYARLSAPRLRFLCTVALARQVWEIFPTKLPDVCRYLAIPLQHHNAASDADACAAIVCAAWATPRGQEWIHARTR